MNPAANTSPNAPDTRERKIVLLFCALAAVHVFIFSAAFPFFNNMDEMFHFDLVVKYSHGHLPRGLEIVSAETTQYANLYSSPEFVCLPKMFSAGQFPAPPWKQGGTPSILSTNQQNSLADIWWHLVKDPKKSRANYEASEQPLFYALTGFWWRIAPWLGQTGLEKLYWVRFMNIFFVCALVWVSYLCAKTIFPKNVFIQIGVPAIIAFMPQQAFYSIDNDVLSPLSFGLAFFCMAHGARSESPDIKFGVATGLALAATLLTKLSNAPLLAVSAVAVLLKIVQLKKTGKIRASIPTLTALFFCAALPIAIWLAWSKYAFDDFAGTAAKVRAIGWTPKPPSEWLHHPIFTLNGAWTFLSDLLAAYWQRDISWHANPLHLPTVDAIYVVATLSFVALALAGLLSRSENVSKSQRQMLWLSFVCFISGIVFLAFLSVQFNFGDCPYPSPDYPYFISGRLILGSLIPFLLILLYGIHHLFGSIKNRWLHPMIIAGIILFMLISEIVTDWSVFHSQYNWYHM